MIHQLFVVNSKSLSAFFPAKTSLFRPRASRHAMAGSGTPRAMPRAAHAVPTDGIRVLALS